VLWVRDDANLHRYQDDSFHSYGRKLVLLDSRRFFAAWAQMLAIMGQHHAPESWIHFGLC
jgi:hypothetical protein